MTSIIHHNTISQERDGLQLTYTGHCYSRNYGSYFKVKTAKMSEQAQQAQQPQQAPEIQVTNPSRDGNQVTNPAIPSSSEPSPEPSPVPRLSSENPEAALESGVAEPQGDDAPESSSEEEASEQQDTILKWPSFLKSERLAGLRPEPLVGLWNNLPFLFSPSTTPDGPTTAEKEAERERQGELDLEELDREMEEERRQIEEQEMEKVRRAKEEMEKQAAREEQEEHNRELEGGQSTPFFLPPPSPNRPNLAPFMLSAQKPGESPTSYRVRDQIERSEYLMGRPLTDEQRRVIEETVRELRTPSVFSHASYSTVESPIEEMEDDDDQEEPDLATTQFRTKALADSVNFTNEQVDSILKELDQHRAMLVVLNAQVKDLEMGKKKQQKQRQNSTSSASAEDDTGTFASLLQPYDPFRHDHKHASNPLHKVMVLVLSIFVLTWIVTEAMLLSKRLMSSGYAPFISMGYGGMGSVVVFSSWTKFVVFQAAVLFLGVMGVRGAFR